MESNTYLIEIINKRTHPHLKGEYIGRPSILGNPFIIGRDGTRYEVVVKYKEWLKSKLEAVDMPILKELERLTYILDEGKLKLICYCAPKLCHGEVLAHIISFGSGLHDQEEDKLVIRNE